MRKWRDWLGNLAHLYQKCTLSARDTYEHLAVGELRKDAAMISFTAYQGYAGERDQHLVTTQRFGRWSQRGIGREAEDR